MEITQLLAFMVKSDASDLYLTAGRAPSFKVNGSVKPAAVAALSEEDTEKLAKSVLTEDQQRELIEKKEFNNSLYYPEIGRFRFNFYRQKGTLAMVIRKIETKIKTLDDLLLPQVLKDISMTKRGLVLVVGATGSGKSTTLAAMINHRNETEAGHIMTIEDPIEFVRSEKSEWIPIHSKQR